MLLSFILHQVNKDIEEDIEIANRKIRRLTDETEEYYQSAAEALNNEITQLNQYKQVVQSTAVHNFCEVFKVIKNISYEKFKESNFKNADYNSFEIVKLSSGYDGKTGKLATSVVGVVSSIVFSPLVGLPALAVSELIRGSRLTDELAAVKATLAEQKTICEEAKIRADVLRDTSVKCGELVKIMQILNSLVSEATNTIQSTITHYGNNYDDWQEEEQYLLMTAVNMVAGLNKIIVTPVVNEDGSLNSTFVKVVEQSKALPEGKPMDFEKIDEEEEEIYYYACDSCIDLLCFANFSEDFYIYKPEYGDSKQGIAAGTPFEDIQSSWKCPCCGAGKERLRPIPAKPQTQNEVRSNLARMKSETDYHAWVAGMLIFNEYDIKGLSVSEKHKKINEEIERIETCYDSDTIKQAAKHYGYSIKGYDPSDKCDREWIELYVKSVRSVKKEQLKSLQGMM